MHDCRSVLPSLANEISKREEGGHPDGGPAICKAGELPIFQARNSSHERGKVTGSRNEIADCEDETADAVKPRRYTMETLRREMDIFAVSINHFSAEFPANQIAQRNPAGTAQKTRQKCQICVEAAFPDEIAAKDEQSFIGNGQTHNTEHQQNKQAWVPVLCEPCEDSIHAAVEG